MTTAWYRFSAPNLQTLYGYGTLDESNRWVEQLNRNRHGNFYCAKKLTAAEVQELRLDEAENREALSIARALKGATNSAP